MSLAEASILLSGLWWPKFFQPRIFWKVWGSNLTDWSMAKFQNIGKYEDFRDIRWYNPYICLLVLGDPHEFPLQFSQIHPLGPFGLEANRWKKGQKDGTHHVAAEKPESIDKESCRLSAGQQAGKPHEFEIVQYVMICYDMLCLFMFLIGGLEHFYFFPYIGNVIIPTDFNIFEG